jgi:hypothetical protein
MSKNNESVLMAADLRRQSLRRLRREAIETESPDEAIKGAFKMAQPKGIQAGLFC